VRKRIKEPQVLCDPWPKTVKANSNDQHEMTARKKIVTLCTFRPSLPCEKRENLPQTMEKYGISADSQTVHK